MNHQIETTGREGEGWPPRGAEGLVTRAAVSHLQAALTEAPPLLQVVHGGGVLHAGRPVLRPAGGRAVAKRTVLSLLVRPSSAEHKEM